MDERGYPTSLSEATAMCRQHVEKLHRTRDTLRAALQHALVCDGPGALCDECDACYTLAWSEEEF